MTTEQRPSAGEASAEKPDPKPAKSILIVDDQKDERAIQRAMLEHLGYAVSEAADGEAAVKAARDEAPDLVLLDVAMPRMDGLAVCRKLRQDPRTAGMAILFYTAASTTEMEERVRTAGGNGFLIKPVDPHEVAREVEKLIGPPLS